MHEANKLADMVKNADLYEPVTKEPMIGAERVTTSA